MIEVINSKDIKSGADLVCTHCGQDHSLYSKENIDYVFERDTNSREEWCICIKCKSESDKK